MNISPIASTCLTKIDGIAPFTRLGKIIEMVWTANWRTKKRHGSIGGF